MVSHSKHKEVVVLKLEVTCRKVFYKRRNKIYWQLICASLSLCMCVCVDREGRNKIKDFVNCVTTTITIMDQSYCLHVISYALETTPNMVSDHFSKEIHKERYSRWHSRLNQIQ